MKILNILKKWMVFVLLPFMASCEYEYPMPMVSPDLGFASSGLQVYDTNSEYEDAIAVVKISRTYGVSKEIEMTIAVDEALVSEYNALYSADYGVLHSKYYSMPSTITFPANTKEVDVAVRINPHAMVADLGYEDANNLILPIKLVSANVEAEYPSSSNTVLLTPQIAAPMITVDASVSTTLSFLTSVPLTQQVNIKSLSNFNTVDVSKVSFEVDIDKVEAFNTEHGTDHIIVPTGYFTIQEDVFNAETMEMTSVVTFDCSTLDDSKTYILPLTLQQTAAYGITQDETIYIVVTLTDLRVWPQQGGNLLPIGGGQGTVELRVNSPLLEDLMVPMYYDEAKIATYNAANGTSYQSLQASKVSTSVGQITAGGITGSLSYELAISDLGYDDGNIYLIPLTIDSDALSLGAQVTDNPTVYLRLAKTITGTYTREEIGYTQHEDNSQNNNSKFNTLIRLVNGTTVPTSTTGRNQKYAINYDTGWSDGLLYFNLSTEEMAGKPGCYQLIDFQDRPQGYDPITDHGSYFDSNTGDIYFNMSILGYWSTREFNLRLYNRAD